MPETIENAVDTMNAAIDGVVDLFRREHGRSPTRMEIYEVYHFAMQGRLFSDDEARLMEVAS